MTGQGICFNDVISGHGPDLAKSYSSDEYKNGAGRGQRIAMEARGGTFRDHSVAVCLELDKISYLHQMFDKVSVLVWAAKKVSFFHSACFLSSQSDAE